MRMTADEPAAVQRVTAIESERAMVDATGASGGSDCRSPSTRRSCSPARVR